MKYKILYIDPPWEYGNFRFTKTVISKRSIFGVTPYPVMPTKELSKLKIKHIMSKDAVVVLWLTMPVLIEAFQVLKSWGFKYKRIFHTWVKLNRSGIGYFFGIGHYTRSNSEMCIVGTLGDGLPEIDVLPELLISPLTKHSSKPNIVRNNILKTFGDLPRIELFARHIYPGWTCVGNELDNMDIKVSLKQLIDNTYKKPVNITLDVK